MRSYLCGEEFNSVIAEEDSASVKSSEATVTQPIPPDELEAEGDFQSKEAKEQQQIQNSSSNFCSKEEAAIVIQSAFRAFLVNPHSQNTQFLHHYSLDKYLSRKWFWFWFWFFFFSFKTSWIG